MIITEDIYKYSEAHTFLPNEILTTLERQTHLCTTQPHMLSGHLQGALLTLFAKMIDAKNILDIGTFTGYSAICLAAGVSDNGIVHTIDIDEEKKTIVAEHITQSGLAEKIKTYIGKALDIIPMLPTPFDIVFIDADKENYASYYDAVLPKMKQGGLIIADNVLWKGKVLGHNQDRKTTMIHEFNQKVLQDERVENILLPIRDGLMIVRIK